jgi:hypothetical protein
MDKNRYGKINRDAKEAFSLTLKAFPSLLKKIP